MRRMYLFPTFLLCLIFTILIIIFGRVGALSFFQNSIQDIFFPVSSSLRNHLISSSPEMVKLEKENEMLRQQVSDIARLEADNKALRDQFQTVNPVSTKLLPAAVVGMPGSVPNISFPETVIIDKGSSDAIVKGMSVVDQNFLVGIVSNTSSHFSEVTLTTSKESSLSVKDEKTGAIGIVKGQGNESLLLDNVLLSDQIKNNDTLVSLGSQTISGEGIMPGLIVGKILSIDKNPSSLFQTAQIMPLIPFDRLTTVFVVIK